MFSCFCCMTAENLSLDVVLVSSYVATDMSLCQGPDNLKIGHDEWKVCGVVHKAPNPRGLQSILCIMCILVGKGE